MKCIIWYVSIIARYELQAGYPTIMLLKAGENETVHNGPTDPNTLIEFINMHTGRGPRTVKVCKAVITITIITLNDMLLF